MKIRKLMLVVLAMTACGANAFARPWDSVGVYWREAKTVVQINEGNANVWPGSRLHALMDAIGADANWDFVNATETVVIRCGRNTTAATCTFRFVSGVGVSSEPRQITAMVPLTELASAGFNAKVAEFAPVEFLNSNGDRFAAEISAGELRIRASKR
ncbi:MAG: hypothetical protein KF767_13615 [Bdellovibrionaceae bacterium]|nr:hypothetical protein [Pseudobdellovibrionaceae bacterium]